MTADRALQTFDDDCAAIIERLKGGGRLTKEDWAAVLRSPSEVAKDVIGAKDAVAVLDLMSKSPRWQMREIQLLSITEFRPDLREEDRKAVADVAEMVSTNAATLPVKPFDDSNAHRAGIESAMRLRESIRKLVEHKDLKTKRIVELAFSEPLDELIVGWGGEKR